MCFPPSRLCLFPSLPSSLGSLGSSQAPPPRGSRPLPDFLSLLPLPFLSLCGGSCSGLLSPSGAPLHVTARPFQSTQGSGPLSADTHWKAGGPSCHWLVSTPQVQAATVGGPEESWRPSAVPLQLPGGPVVGEGEGRGSYKKRGKVRSEWEAGPPARKLSAPQHKVPVGQRVWENQLSPSLLL